VALPGCARVRALGVLVTPLGDSVAAPTTGVLSAAFTRCGVLARAGGAVLATFTRCGVLARAGATVLALAPCGEAARVFARVFAVPLAGCAATRGEAARILATAFVLPVTIALPLTIGTTMRAAVTTGFLSTTFAS